MAGVQLVNGKLITAKNPLQAQLDAVNAQNQSYQQQLAALQQAINRTNVYQPSYPANQTPTTPLQTYTPVSSQLGAHWNPTGIQSILPSTSQPSANWNAMGVQDGLAQIASGGIGALAGGASAGGK